jgi:hypothetical protein
MASLMNQGGDAIPPNLIRFALELAAEYKLMPNDIKTTVRRAWLKIQRTGGRIAPRTSNWFFEVLRNAYIPGYDRPPEQPAARSYAMSPAEAVPDALELPGVAGGTA